MKPCPELSREYLLFWLLADETCGRINATCTGARMPRAQMNDVLGFDIPVPPLAEQQRIVAKLDAFSSETQRLARIYERKLAALEALKKSLLHRAFSGEL
ncbi:MAG: hypothetical protein GXY61_04695 [Lentisphaerae bacterium]|nr:hypothetical protein [Lentisphaerota bacterium]